MKNVFNKTHIGQKVNSAETGNGVIMDCNGSINYPVHVKNESGDIVHFSTCGRHFIGNVYPTLAFRHKEPVTFDYGTPEIVLEPLVMGDRSILAYVSDLSLEEAMRNKRRRIVLCKKSYDGLLDSQYLTIRTDTDTGSSFFVSNYKYAVKIPDSDKIIL